MTIGALARKTGKSVRAIHLYEEMGLLHPTERSKGGYRLYSERATARIEWITKLQDMGFSLADVRDFLKGWQEAEVAPEAMGRVRVIFEQKLAETREAMRKLRGLEEDLLASLKYLSSCGRCEPVNTTDSCVECNRLGHDHRQQPTLVLGLHQR
jgi:DNA-binding transcriptional MerR regulator